jgi:hypothetical protein
MKKAAAILGAYLLLLALFAGCSGNSPGGNSNQPITYPGVVTQAVVTADNAQFIASSIVGSATPTLLPQSIAETVTGLAGSSVTAKRPDGFRRVVFKLVGSSSIRAETVATPVNVKLHGAVSGSVTYSGSVNDDGTGSLNFDFTNYNDGEGYTYDGTGTITVNNYSTTGFMATDSNLVISRLTVRTASSSSSMSGTIRITRDIEKFFETRVYNVSLRDDSQNQAVKLENFSIGRTYDRWYSPSRYTETNAGRFYLGSYGFVDVSQTSPFNYHYNDQYNLYLPRSGGSLMIIGSGGTKLRITALSISQIRLEADTNGDDAFEITTINQWTDLSGFVFKFEKSIGTDVFDRGKSVSPTSDGGYIITGSTNSSVDAPNVYLVKIDATGEVEWQKTFGGPGGQTGSTVLETSDHGYIIAGYTFPLISYPFGYGGEEIYLVRTDATGNLMWEKKYNGSSQWAFSMQNTADGGFIIMGGITPPFGLSQIYLLKISSSGNKQWDKMLGSGYYDVGKSITVASDCGYVVAGYKKGWYDSIYLIKTDGSGNPVWEKTISKTHNTRVLSILTTASGHFIITGYDGTFGYAASIDASGSLIWEKRFQEYCDIASATEAADGSLVFVANSQTLDVITLIKTDANGTQQWEKPTHGITYSFSPYVNSIKLAKDDGYVATGYVDTTEQNHIANNIYLIKTDKDGNTR